MPSAAAFDVPDTEAGPLTVGGSGRLRVGDIAAVARRRRVVALVPEVGPRMAAARAVVDRLAADGTRAVYGLTTGLGAAVDTRLAADDLAAFQARAIRARAVAVGPRLTVEEVRATLLVRLAGLARGASGVQPGFAEALRDMLNRGVHPRARRGGSLGEADLAPLAGLFLPFAGEGEAEHEGEVLPGPAALARAGIRPPTLGPKDGIGLINANAVSAGTAALALEDMRLALDAVLTAGALSLEGFRANLSVLDPRLVALRPAPGQAAASRRLRDLLAGSDLFEPGAARRVQDPLSFRCLAPVHGIVDLRLAEAAAAVEAELNGAGDSPGVLADDDEMLSCVGFDTSALALSLEGLGQAAAHAATLAGFRTTKLMSGALTGLPRFLASREGRTGFATLGKTAACLEAEIRHLAVPLGPMTMPVADGIEDYAPMTLRIVEKTAGIAARLARLAAVELTVAAATVEARGSMRLGAGTGRALRFVRARIAPLDDDRALGDEIEALAVAIEAGELAAAFEPASAGRAGP